MADGSLDWLSEASSEFAALQQKLSAKLVECDRLRQQIDEVKQIKEQAHNVGKQGISAAKNQMAQLQTDLAAVRKWQQDHQDPVSTNNSATDSKEEPVPYVETDEERSRHRSLQLQARGLRHELARWKHQAEVLDVDRPAKEAEICNAKAELTHISDILESTKHVVRHIELERDLQHSTIVAEQAPSSEIPSVGAEDTTALNQVSNLEAKVERSIRERCEGRTTSLSSKAKKLSGVASAQQLLIQRLEKQVLKEERMLEMKDVQLHSEKQSAAHLKGIMRKRSDEFVAAALGFPFAPRRAASNSPGHLQDDDPEQPPRAQSDMRLPPIEDHHL